MEILFLHGWHSVLEGMKPSSLARHGQEVINAALNNHDFDEAVRTAQDVAMNLESRSTPLVLLCPAWKRWGTAKMVKPGTVILHSEADDLIPIADSRELLRASELPESALIVGGADHRLAEPKPLMAMLEAVGRATGSGRR